MNENCKHCKQILSHDVYEVSLIGKTISSKSSEIKERNDVFCSMNCMIANCLDEIIFHKLNCVHPEFFEVCQALHDELMDTDKTQGPVQSNLDKVEKAKLN